MSITAHVSGAVPSALSIAALASVLRSSKFGVYGELRSACCSLAPHVFVSDVASVWLCTVPAVVGAVSVSVGSVRVGTGKIPTLMTDEGVTSA